MKEPLVFSFFRRRKSTETWGESGCDLTRCISSICGTKQTVESGHKGEVLRICWDGNTLTGICVNLTFARIYKDLDLRNHVDSFGLPAYL